MEKRGKKILVNICTPLKHAVMNRLDDACLKRDAYRCVLPVRLVLLSVSPA
jgi:hypothetical protein